MAEAKDRDKMTAADDAKKRAPDTAPGKRTTADCCDDVLKNASIQELEAAMARKRAQVLDCCCYDDVVAAIEKRK